MLLPAAHCFKNKFETSTKSPRNVRAILNRINASERQSRERSVSKIVLNPEWNTFDLKANADIAVVVLVNSFELNHFQPICLPSLSYDEVNGLGSVVNLEKDTSSAKISNLFTSKHLDCIASFPESRGIISDSTFCALSEADEEELCFSGVRLKEND